MSRVWLISWMALGGLLACSTDSKDPPADTDTGGTESDPDPIVDVDGTFATAQQAPGINDVGVPVALGPEDAINPVHDRDYYKVNLTQGTPYHLWADTGPNVRCDTILRVYPADADETAVAQVDGAACTMNNGDQLAISDDMILRYRDADPGLVFVPPSTGDYFIEVMNFDDAVGRVATGGPWCAYTAYAMKRAAAEVEPNNAADVERALEAAGDPVPPATGYRPDVATPALQPLAPNPFLICPGTEPCGEEISGVISTPDDADLWQFQFGDLGTDDAGAAVTELWWTFSLWETQPAKTPFRLELLDKDLNVVASTDNPVPEGTYGFVNDVGILYAITPHSSWYLRVTSPSPAPSGSFYVGVAQGYNHDIIDCGTGEPAITGWEDESNAEEIARNPSRPPSNDAFDRADLIRFCQVGATSLYAARVSGFIDPDGDTFQFVQLPGADATATELDVELRCGDGTDDACPDREIFSILPTSHPGGALAKRHLMVSVQAATVGSFVEPEVFLFHNNERINPFDTSNDASVGDAIRLGPGDATIDTTTPEDAEQIFIVIQSKTRHPDDRRANAWFMRVMIEDAAPEDEAIDPNAGQECKL